ncbi:MAG TPA: hypothetical protein VF199_12520 [Bacillales bacterium]
MAKVMDDLREHPDVLRIQKYGYARKPMPECFPKPKAVEMFEDIEDDLKCDIVKYKRQRDLYHSHNLPTADVDEFLGTLWEYLEVVREAKNSASEE